MQATSERTLKARATADYPFGDCAGIKTFNGRAVYSGHVDSQNSFGAMIRTRFLCSAPIDNLGRIQNEWDRVRDPSAIQAAILSRGRRLTGRGLWCQNYPESLKTTETIFIFFESFVPVSAGWCSLVFT